MSAHRPVEVHAPVHGVVLDAASPWRRSMVRSASQRQGDYEERFDARTLFYDAFRVDDHIELIGPPLLDLEAGLRPLDLRGGGRRFARRLTWESKDRLQRYRITDVPRDIDALRMRCPLGTFRLTIGQDLAPAFTARRVLVTQSRNNPLSWIADWVDHHVATQGIDAVVIYENASTAYGADAVRDVLRARPGLSVFSVVEWPFPFGPTGGPDAVWDSDFGQHGTWEHAARRLCRDAATITFGDVDELIIGATPTVTDRALAAPTGVCAYRRRSIVRLPERPRRRGDARRFADYCRYEPSAPLLSPKYTVAPSALHPWHQLMVHRVDGIEVEPEPDVLARHFDGMRIEWRDGDDSPVPEVRATEFERHSLTIDQELRRVFAADTEAT